MNEEHEVLGWLEFGEAARHLAMDVLETGFEPDFVIAIARGGLLLGLRTGHQELRQSQR
jgi:hypoxanthine phosphoribosyltransferase